MTRRLLLPLFVLALFAAACSGSDDGADSESQIATLDDGGGASGDDALAATTTTLPEEEVTFEEALLSFAVCMRETYPEWPDPDPDAPDGRRFDREVLQDLGIDFQDQGFRDLLQQCQGDNFQGVAGTADDLSPEEQAELEDNLLALFACVREEPGYEDIPDPDFSGGEGGFGLRELFESNDIDPQEFRTVMQDCQTSLGIEGGGGLRGGGRP
ncbi:MAG: hypothetical protein P8N02_17595 [Actinomycetota bacterium]|nr:hypothetical protein [Actinomycetota bacterium]